MGTLCESVSCFVNDTNNSNNSNNTNDTNTIGSHNRKGENIQKSSRNLQALRIAFGSWLVFLALANIIRAVQSAAVYSNVNFNANPNFEPICSEQQEHFIESDGKESSLILEFSPGVLAENRKSCTRILSAPSNYGFIVRLILPKIRRSRSRVPTSSTSSSSSSEVSAKSKLTGASAINEMTSLIEKLNSTALKTVLGRTCPLSIFSSLDPHTPQWRVDPCQLEDTAPEMEDPVRLFHGRVRIVWEHNHNSLHSKLMVTALGKGDQCRSEDKHQCLRIGDEPILCISKELVCDGIRHCPYSNEYDSDEDYAMCWKRRRHGEPIPPAMETDIFEHFALEVFRNLFAFDVPTASDDSAADKSTAIEPIVNSTTLRKVETNLFAGANASPKETGGSNNANDTSTASIGMVGNATENTGGHHRRNSTRSGLSSDLSKYGPWGYLMLGMLLCGGALLICGLWASASQHAANNERESALQNAPPGSEHQSSTTGPPNYEELEPPPAYSVLFPNQKGSSNTTLSSLGAPTTTAAAVGLPPNATTATTPTLLPAGSAGGGGLATTTQVQMETAAPSHASSQSHSHSQSLSPSHLQLQLQVQSPPHPPPVVAN